MADQQIQIDESTAVPLRTPAQLPPQQAAAAAPAAASQPISVDESTAVPLQPPIGQQPTGQAAATQQPPAGGGLPSLNLPGIGQDQDVGDMALKAGDASYHVMLGALKGAVDTGHVTGAAANYAASKLTGGRIPQVVQFQTPNYLKAQGTPEEVGKVGEGIAEFLLSDGALSELSSADKFATVSKIMKTLETSPRLLAAVKIGSAALRMGTVGAVQSVEEQAKSGAPVDLEHAMRAGAGTGLFGGAMAGLGEAATRAAAPAARAVARAGQATLGGGVMVQQAREALEPRQPGESQSAYEERAIQAGVNSALGALGLREMITSPETAAGVQRVGEAAGAVGEGAKAVGRVARTVAGKAAEMVAQPVRALGATPEVKLEQATRPYTSERDFKQNVGRTLPYLVEQNKTAPIKTLDDMADASAKAKQTLWQTKLSTPHPNQFIEGDAIAAKIKNGINATTRRLYPERAKAIEEWADRFKGQYPLDEALQTASDLNADLRSFYKLSPSEQWKAATSDPKLGMLQDAADAIREHAFTKLEDLGEKDVPELRKDYGALNQLQRVSEKRAVVYGRQAPIDFKTSMGAVAAVATGHPQAAAIPFITKYLNSPEYLIQSAIKKAGKVPKVLGAGEASVTGTLPNLEARFEEPHIENPPAGMDTKAVLNHELGHAAVATKVGFRPIDVWSEEHPQLKGTGVKAQVNMDWGPELNKRADGTLPLDTLNTKFNDVLTTIMGGAAANEVYDGIPWRENPASEGDLRFAHELFDLLGVPKENHDFYLDRVIARAKSLVEDPHTTNVINEFSDTREADAPDTHHYRAARMNEFVNRLNEGDENDINAERNAAGDLEHGAGGEAPGAPEVAEVTAGAGGAGLAAEGKPTKAQELADTIGAKVVGSAAKEGTKPRDLDFRVEDYTPEIKATLEKQGFESLGSSIVSPEEAKASGKPYGPGWNRAEHFQNAAGQKIDVWHSEPAVESKPGEVKPLTSNKKVK